jgi:hypothetical protein
VQIVVVLASSLVAADLWWPAFNEAMNDHQVVSALVAEAVLLAAVYLVVDNEIARRQWARTAAVGQAVADQLHRAGSGVPGNSGGGIRTRDLRVMSPTSYLTAPPRGVDQRM